MRMNTQASRTLLAGIRSSRDRGVWLRPRWGGLEDHCEPSTHQPGVGTGFTESSKALPYLFSCFGSSEQLWKVGRVGVNISSLEKATEAQKGSSVRLPSSDMTGQESGLPALRAGAWPVPPESPGSGRTVIHMRAHFWYQEIL